jgi:hypothetical protein
MHTLTFSLSLSDDAQPHMEWRISSNESDGDLVIAQPPRTQTGTSTVPTPAVPASAENNYELGGYAGI